MYDFGKNPWLFRDLHSWCGWSGQLLQFEYLTSLGFAAIVIFLGHAIVKRSALLKKFAIPAPVVSGLLFSIAVAILKASGVMAFSFDVKTIQDLCQNIFFMCVASASAGS